MFTLRQTYDRSARESGFVEDSSQSLAIEALEQCIQALQNNHASGAQGVYLWGPVGRGKTWLMDLLHQHIPVPSRRQHFHHFMQWVHRRLFALTGTLDPLKQLAAELAMEIRVLCFDELFVTDIGDAMLLGGLFQAMFDAGIFLVTTSNQAPDQLYAGGFNRERFLPAIDAMQRHMRIIEVDGGQDYRLQPAEPVSRYWVNNRQAIADTFSRLSGGLPTHEEALQLNGRALSVVRYSDTILWVRFADLCGQAFAAAEFMALCDRFRAIALGEVPALGGQAQAQKIAPGTEDGAEQVLAGDRQLPALAVSDNSARRFIALVDECYDRRVPLYIDAAVPLRELYTEGHLTGAFRRTLSRLQAMQSRRF